MEPQPTTGPAPHWRLTHLLLAGMVLSQLTNAMVNVAVPTMLTDLGAGDERAGWIISASLLPMAVLMPTWGAAGDLFGRRRAFRLGLLIFGAGAVISALATSLPVLLAGQVVQAAGASSLNPNGTALIGEAGGPRGRGRALGRQRMILSLAGIAGAPAGGLLVQAFGWHAIFLVAPVLAAAVAARLGRFDAEPRPARAPGVRFDAAGAAVITATLLALLAALSLGRSLGWTSPVVLGLAGGALAGLLLVWPVEARQARPLIPPALFRQPAYLAVIITGLLQAFACFGTALLGPLLLQRVFAFEPAQMGWLLASFQVGMASGGIPGGRLVDRFGGQRLTAASLVGVAAGLLVLREAAVATLPWLFVPGALLTGLMASVGLTAMAAVVLHVCGAERRGVGMGVFTMVSITGDIVGVALLPMLLVGQAGAGLAAAFGNVYLVAALVALAGLLPVLAIRSGAAAPAAGPAIAGPAGEAP
jgi:MFS family permease